MVPCAASIGAVGWAASSDFAAWICPQMLAPLCASSRAAVSGWSNWSITAMATRAGQESRIEFTTRVG